jgi:hypothetical protein
MPIIIWIAAITKAAIGDFPDVAILLATAKRNGKWSYIDAGTVVLGD